MKFSAIAEQFAVIEQRSSRTEIIKILADLLGSASAHECEMLAYLVLGSLRAPYIGTQFNMAEKLAIKVIADLLHTTVADITAARQKTGDLGAVLLVGTWRATGEPTLTEVYKSLEIIAAVSGTGAHEERHEALITLLRSLDPVSAQYVVRIVLGKLRLGFSDMTVIDALSWMITGDKTFKKELEEAYTLCADLGKIAYTARAEGKKGISEIGIVVGIPIRPAAAERLTSAHDIIEKIGHCVAQPKLDGFRLQIHVKKSSHKGGKPTVWFFSRNLLTMTDQFPELRAAFEDFSGESLIVEGEAIVFDEATDSFLPFQETVKRKRKHGIEEAAREFPLKIFLFDLLYYDGKSYLDRGHEVRRAELLKLFPPKSHVKSHAQRHDYGHDATISVIDEREFSSAANLEEYFLEIVANGLEGVMAKKPNATYQAGKRNFNWIKLKRHSAHTLEDTIDAVILGYYLGSGKRAKFGIGAFLVGIYDTVHDRFETVAKVGTGMSDSEWRELKKRCDEEAVRTQPHNVLCNKALVPDVWVYPKLVCAVQAEEITRSPLHSAGKDRSGNGFALRFPRFIEYRTDKSAAETTTEHELHTLYKHQMVVQKS